MRSLWLFTSLAVFALWSVGQSHAAPNNTVRARSLTLQQAVAHALRHNPSLVSSNSMVKAAQLRVKASKAQRLPSVNLSAIVSRWDKALGFVLNDPITMMPAELIIREQITSSVSVRLTQPLSGLLVIDKLIDRERTGVSIARTQLSRAQLDIAARAAMGYIAVLQARAVHKVAVSNVERLRRQLVIVRSQVKLGARNKVDGLRLETAVAIGRQQVLAAATAVRNADEALLLVLGLPLTTRLQVVDGFAKVPAPPTQTSAQVVRAAANRPALSLAKQRTAQARLSHQLARSLLFPEINAVAQFDRNDGLGSLAAKHQWFIGVTLQWQLWDWGKNYNNAKSAKVVSSALELQRQTQTRVVRLEARTALRTAHTAHRSLVVALKGLETAREAHRIQQARFDSGALGMTELLESLKQLGEAGLNATLRRFDYLLARVRLQRAMGVVPK